ncbi:hypothetical protein B0I35DRAFT_412020 [Stachybotrys elegans]|uniref:Uncharacterized protein n=1 Tax=Stachybotrys elegans TaxID=80388 RepID=A0A8K0SKS1_9HYPO|nr:hypothetical protein B0I35DRAFT_412020 [Stachybotrys elegans]
MAACYTKIWDGQSKKNAKKQRIHHRMTLTRLTVVPAKEAEEDEEDEEATEPLEISLLPALRYDRSDSTLLWSGRAPGISRVQAKKLADKRNGELWLKIHSSPVTVANEPGLALVPWTGPVPQSLPEGLPLLQRSFDGISPMNMPRLERRAIEPGPAALDLAARALLGAPPAAAAAAAQAPTADAAAAADAAEAIRVAQDAAWARAYHEAQVAAIRQQQQELQARLAALADQRGLPPAHDPLLLEWRRAQTIGSTVAGSEMGDNRGGAAAAAAAAGPGPGPVPPPGQAPPPGQVPPPGQAPLTAEALARLAMPPPAVPVPGHTAEEVERAFAVLRAEMAVAQPEYAETNAELLDGMLQGSRALRAPPTRPGSPASTVAALAGGLRNMQPIGTDAEGDAEMAGAAKEKTD